MHLLHTAFPVLHNFTAFPSFLAFPRGVLVSESVPVLLGTKR